MKILGVLVVSLYVCLVSAQELVIPFSVTEEISEAVVGVIPESEVIRGRYTADEYSSFVYQWSPNPSQQQELFSLNSSTGQVRTRESVDRESWCPPAYSACFMNLDVSVVQPLDFLQVLRLRVTLLDINDNPPAFIQEVLELSFNELSPIGTTHPLPSARDSDSPQYGVLGSGYALQGGTAGLFTLVYEQNQLFLELQSVLDRESQDKYDMILVAYDQGSPPLSASLSLIITVTDANDHTPQFTQSDYQVTVAEDVARNSTLVTVQAEDRDIGPNGAILYRLGTLSSVSYGDLFNLNSTSGDLYLTSNLNYEEESFYELEVIAADSGADSKMATSTVQITVTDVNDNQPEVQINALSTDPTVASIAENLPPGEFVAFVIVTDLDGGDNGLVSCSLQHDDFQLEGLAARDQYKVTTRRELDREEQDAYSDILIICVDGGQPALSGTGTVSVIVQDENDNNPVFTESVYTTSVPENSGIGTSLVTVQATDLDIGANGAVRYFLPELSRDQYISIDSLTGKVLLASPVDYETVQSLQISVGARDSGTPPTSAIVSLEVTIIDLNDNPPVFSQSEYSFSVEETPNIESPVGSVSATDLDSTSSLMYSLPEGGDAQGFSIEATTGLITARGQLDREQTEMYTFLVLAVDPQDTSLVGSATVTVHVMDVNDNVPRIIYPTSDSTNISMSTLVPIGYSVLQVSAVDPDAGENSSLVYTIAEEHSGSETILDIGLESGIVKVAADLSGWVVPVNVSVTVTVSDSGPAPLSTAVSFTLLLSPLLPLPPGLTPSTTPHVPEQQISGSNTNTRLIIGISVVTFVVVVALVIAIVVLRRGRFMMTKKQSSSHPPVSVSMGMSKPFTPATDITSDQKDSGLIPIALPIPDSQVADDSGSSVHSQDSGRGPSEGGEGESIGVRKIGSGRQRPISIFTGNQAPQTFPSDPRTEHSPKSTHSSGHYQPIEPYQNMPQNPSRKSPRTPTAVPGPRTPTTPHHAQQNHFQFPSANDNSAFVFPTHSHSTLPPNTPTRAPVSPIRIPQSPSVRVPQSPNRTPQSPNKKHMHFQFPPQTINENEAVTQFVLPQHIPVSPTKMRQFAFEVANSDYMEHNPAVIEQNQYNENRPSLPSSDHHHQQSQFASTQNMDQMMGTSNSEDLHQINNDMLFAGDQALMPGSRIRAHPPPLPHHPLDTTLLQRQNSAPLGHTTGQRPSAFVNLRRSGHWEDRTANLGRGGHQAPYVGGNQLSSSAPNQGGGFTDNPELHNWHNSYTGLSNHQQNNSNQFVNSSNHGNEFALKELNCHGDSFDSMRNTESPLYVQMGGGRGLSLDV